MLLLGLFAENKFLRKKNSIAYKENICKLKISIVFLKGIHLLTINVAERESRVGQKYAFIASAMLIKIIPIHL